MVMSKTVNVIGEFGLIDLMKKALPGVPRNVIGIGDDTAVVPLDRNNVLLLTTDMLVEDVHFHRRMPLEQVGYKAMACSISDIAAMGGIPQYAVISLGTPAREQKQNILKMYQGIRRAASKFRVAVVGGDTVKSEKVVINVAMTGRAQRGKVVVRSGARPGDAIFVTGALGNSLRSGWHLNFIPRLKESAYLMRHSHPTSMIDISDGLAADLGHILEQSHVGAVLDEINIPLRRGADLTGALSDGEDFELLFTIPKKEAGRLERLSGRQMQFVRIGEITPHQCRLELRLADGKFKRLQLRGYTHF